MSLISMFSCFVLEINKPLIIENNPRNSRSNPNSETENFSATLESDFHHCSIDKYLFYFILVAFYPNYADQL